MRMAPGEMYGTMVFNDDVMQQRLPHDTYKQLKRILEEGGALDRSIADIVANAMKDWALEKGATHFTHWFQPMTGITAEKHDSFIRPMGDRVIMEFSGKELIKGENDASSFPSGGLRATFEARGYTAWDPTSYAFIKDKTLCIPTAFCSYTGEALDKKTPLLRSMELLNRHALKVLSILGVNARRVVPMVGAEQEYFLIDRALYEKRPDLIYTGRTLLGHRPSKGQELDDHFFGALKTRVSAFMRDLDEELWKLGIPAKTCHNEAAPAQHELACVYESVNVAVDHNQLTMEIMKKVATRHGMVCLLHEKPFEGVNGSGKHNNWSLQTDTGRNLLDPGEHPAENLPFLLMLCAVIQAVDDNQDLLRISIASAGNDHRLGGNEAPPAIMSMYLGDDISALIDSIAGGTPLDSLNREYINSGVGTLSRVYRDNTDRNRTSPLAFTGNKFEFRSVGSSFSISDANVVLNTAVADRLERFARRLEGQADLRSAVYALVRETVKDHDRILFNGNNYSAEWAEEARRRGLMILNNTVDALEQFTTQKNVSLFTRHGIFSETEMFSRREVMLENYAKVVNIEAHTLLDMVNRDVLPALIRYTGELADAAAKKRAIGLKAQAEYDLGSSLSSLTDEIWTLSGDLNAAILHASREGVTSQSARAYADCVLPAMEKLRLRVDEAEGLTDEKTWPYPGYGELLSSVHE
ncbi:MAG: glutamine synthetase III [Clostridia bacterium]|nr:glutamine synthetase III [Clostridia bacterium]